MTATAVKKQNVLIPGSGEIPPMTKAKQSVMLVIVTETAASQYVLLIRSLTVVGGVPRQAATIINMLSKPIPA